MDNGGKLATSNKWDTSLFTQYEPNGTCPIYLNGRVPFLRYKIVRLEVLTITYPNDIFYGFKLIKDFSSNLA